MHRQYLHLGSRTISYFDSAPASASANVLVLVHAFPLGAGMWEGQLRALPDGWRLLAPDLRGFGGSTLPTPDSDASIDDYAADVIDLLRELDVSSAVIAGLSLGGYVAFAMLRHAPRLARAVVLADTRASADTSEGRANRRSMLALIDREGASGVVRDMIPKLLGKTTLAERGDVEPVVRRLIKQQSPVALRGAVQRMMERPDSFATVQRLTIPILVIVGDEDTLTPVDDAKKLVTSNPKAELVVIAGSGHLPNLEQPDAFNRALQGFLARL